MVGKKQDDEREFDEPGDAIHHVIAQGVLDEPEPAEGTIGPAVVDPVVGPDQATASVSSLAQEVRDGKWGTGNNIRRKLISAGHDVRAVMAEVDRLS